MKGLMKKRFFTCIIVSILLVTTLILPTIIDYFQLESGDFEQVVLGKLLPIYKGFFYLDEDVLLTEEALQQFLSNQTECTVKELLFEPKKSMEFHLILLGKDEKKSQRTYLWVYEGRDIIQLHYGQRPDDGPSKVAFYQLSRPLDISMFSQLQ